MSTKAVPADPVSCQNFSLPPSSRFHQLLAAEADPAPPGRWSSNSKSSEILDRRDVAGRKQQLWSVPAVQPSQLWQRRPWDGGWSTRCQPSAPAPPAGTLALPSAHHSRPGPGPRPGAVRHQPRRGHPGSGPAFLHSAREDGTLWLCLELGKENLRNRFTSSEAWERSDRAWHPSKELQLAASK